uniref:Uncharacterized protein n=1 Tax=Anopheles dirus TaxID=7168 RepID=A0A182NWF0_9DIPT
MLRHMPSKHQTITFKMLTRIKEAIKGIVLINGHDNILITHAVKDYP